MDANTATVLIFTAGIIPTFLLMRERFRHHHRWEEQERHHVAGLPTLPSSARAYDEQGTVDLLRTFNGYDIITFRCADCGLLKQQRLD